MDSETPRTIPVLIAAAKSSDLAVAGIAFREILKRHPECHGFVEHLIELLGDSNAAISDYAFRTLERIGQPAVALLINEYHESNGKFRCLLMGLICEIAEYDTYFPLLKNEIENESGICQYWAANCLGRKFDDESNWPHVGMETLNRSINILLSLRNDPEHWVQARMTLKRLGRLTDSAE